MIPIRDNIPSETTPYVSWGLIAICTLVFLTMKTMPYELQRQLTYLYGMMPIRYSNPQWAAAFGLPSDGYLSFFTNLFLHGGWFHIISNVWFIWIFADNIEDKMGHGKFLLFYLSCGFIATFAQWYSDPELTIPLVGASGAIAGVLGAYFFIFPYARVVVWFPFFFLPIFFELPAVAFLGFWVIIQFQNATSSVLFEDVASSIAWWAHLGGFVAGAFLYPLFLKGEQPKDDSPKQIS